MTPVLGAVLTGGRSTRMGRDKALVELDGIALAARVAATLAAGGATRVVAIGGDRPALCAIGLEVVEDEFPGTGPLGGIATALGLEHDAVVVAGCDTPFVSAGTVAALCRALDDPALDAVVADIGGRPQPLVAVYRARCRDRLVARLATGGLAVRDALAALTAGHVAVADAGEGWNLNRPHDLDRAMGLRAGRPDGRRAR